MPRIGGHMDVVQVSADPTTPPAGRQHLYFKSDGVLYTKRSDGTVAPVAGSGTAPANMVTTDTTQTITGSKTFQDIFITSKSASVSAMGVQGQANQAGATMVLYQATGQTAALLETRQPDYTTVLASIGSDGLFREGGAQGLQRLYSPNNPPPAPTNMVTTNTAQTVSAAKTFSAPVTASTTGATAGARWVGSTTGGAPTTGTFAVGDWVTTTTAQVWICTTAGTPGAWTQVGGGTSGNTSNFVTTDTVQTITADKTFSGGVKVQRWNTVATTPASEGSWIDLPDGAHPSGIGNGGIGVNVLLGLPKASGHFFADSVSDDLVFRARQGKTVRIGADNGAGTAASTLRVTGAGTVNVGTAQVNGVIFGDGGLRLPGSFKNGVGTNLPGFYFGSQSQDVAAFGTSEIGMGLDSSYRLTLCAPTSRVSGNLEVAGAFTGAGDMTVSAAGSTLAAPRVVGISGFTTDGQAARVQFGDNVNAIQSGTGRRQQLTCFHGIEVVGGRGLSTGLDFVPGGGTADASLIVRAVGAVAQTGLLVNHEVANPTGDLARFTVGGATRARIAADGGIYDGVNRVYSDSNPPETFMQTVTTTAPAAPPAGQTVMTVRGKSVLVKFSDNTELDLTATAAGSASGTTIGITQDYTDTTPAAPATGLVAFTRQRTRRLLATVGPSGQDTSYQPALFANRVARYAVVNNTIAPSLDGIAVTALNGPTAVANASTNFFTGMVRHRFATTATAGVGAGTRSNTLQWFLSSTANLGGFFFVCRFGMNASVAAGRGFIGLAALAGTAPATAVYPAGINPSTQVNQIGFGWDQTHTTMRFMSNGATADATRHVDLLANFPVNGGAGASATNFFEVRLFAPSGAGQNVRWSATRLNDGAFQQGQITLATALPAVGTMLGAHVHISNGATAAASSIDLQSLYIETDN